MTETKRIYLHIGMPKTGSSSLQAFCGDNRQVLESYGYSYPIMPVAYPAISKVRNAHFLIGNMEQEAGGIDEAATSEKRRQGFSYLRESLERFPNVILSDEGIWNTLTEKRKGALEDIKAFCDNNGVELKVVVYLRRQDGYLESYWKQKIRRRAATWKWKRVVRHTPSYIALDYYEHLCGIAEQIGKDNLIVRRYERGSFGGAEGTIFSDFLEAVGLEMTQEYVPLSEQRNTSLNNNYAEIKRIMNHLLSEEAGPREREGAWLERIAVECSRFQKTSYESSMFSVKERKSFMKRYEEGNERTAREFMGEDTLFSEDDVSLPQWSRDNKQQYEDTLLFLGTVLLEQKRELDELRRELHAGLNRSLAKRIYQKLTHMFF